MNVIVVLDLTSDVKLFTMGCTEDDALAEDLFNATTLLFKEPKIHVLKIPAKHFHAVATENEIINLPTGTEYIKEQNDN